MKTIVVLTVTLCLLVSSTHINGFLEEEPVCSHHCNHNGYCVTNTGTHEQFCLCHTGYAGKNCEFIGGCLAGRCHNHGTCHSRTQAPWFRCDCPAAYTGLYCEIPVTTTIPTTTTITTTTTTSTSTSVTTPFHVPTKPHHNTGYSCPLVSSTQAFLEYASSYNATPCPSGEMRSPEAFVMTYCNVTKDSTTWKQGESVSSHCSEIPMYTPVATFIQGLYTAQGGLTGVFLGCLSSGFRVALQRCGLKPSIESFVNGGIFTNDPTVYFTIMHID